jgi:hypothetical protein
LKTGCWGGYLDRREMRWQENWRELHNEELHDLYSSPSIIRIITLRKMRWVGHVAQMGEKERV